MGQSRGDAEHLLRIAGLFLAGAVAFVALRGALIPEGFGLYGHYRAGAIDDNRAEPLVHAGRAACTACHPPAAAALAGGAHARLGCEACHGPLAAHAAEPSKAKAARPEARSLCLRCHGALVSRPAKFPQVEASEHAPEGACTECHTAHAPGM